MEHDGQLTRNASEIPPPPFAEEDYPKVGPVIPRASIEEIKVKGEEARRDADSEHSRKRDTWVTVAGLILVFILMLLYWFTAFLIKPNDYLSSFLYLLNSVIMLIIGYIFGTKITRQ